ncbi:MAG TPA: hypothetical protein VGO55_08835 [Allosphingosinicella sp.]|nr:hypothetical protein [Allosphingosinicella sp.]
MATALKERPRVEAPPVADVEAFLRDLEEVGRRHGIGLTDGASLYLMEPEDFARSYLANDASELTFA